jgi:hypothetical protein
VLQKIKKMAGDAAPIYIDWFVRSQTEVALACTPLDFRSAEPDASKRISALDEQQAQPLIVHIK